MKNPLKLVFQLLVVFSLLAGAYYFFSNSSGLKEAQNRIKILENRLEMVQDSLSSSQEKVDDLIFELEKGEIRIRSLQNQQDIILTEIKRDQTNNRKELEEYRKRLEELEKEREELREEAKKFDL